MNARILALLLLGAVALAACGGDDAVPPKTTPALTATVAATPAPTATAAAATALDESFRAFATEIDAATRAGDVAFFMERLTTEPVVCTEEMVRDRYAGPACAADGERFAGFTIGKWRGSGAVVPVATVESLLDEAFFGAVVQQASDEFGSGAPRVYAINMSGGRYSAILTAIHGANRVRMAIVTEWERLGADWRMTHIVMALGSGRDFLQPDEAVRSYYPQWERFAPP